MTKRFRKGNRIISILLLAVMLLTTVPAAVFAADAAHPLIAMDTEMAVELNGTDKTEVFFSFVPTETDYYQFISFENSIDTVGYILNSNGEVINRNDDSEYKGGANFCVAALLTAGETYLLKATAFRTEYAGSFKVMLEKALLATSISFEDNGSFSNYVGSNEYFKIKVLPAGAYAGELTWSTGNPEIVSFNEEKAQAKNLFFKSAGSATVTVTSSLGFSTSQEMTVIEAPEITLGTVTPAVNTTYETPSFRFTPTETAEYAFCTIGNEGSDLLLNIYNLDMVHEVSDFVSDYNNLFTVFFAEANKTYTLSLSHYDPSGSVNVVVCKPTALTGITLDKTSITGKIGDTFKLNVIKNAINEITEEIIWSTTNDTVASVENGVVKLLSNGTATVTATSESGFTASCTVTVDGYRTIKRCDPKDITLTQGDSVLFYFIPEVDGTYSFYTTDNYGDTYGYILTADGEVLCEDNNSGMNGNFNVRCEMTAGTLYLLKANLVNYCISGSFKAKIALLNENGNAVHSSPEYTHNHAEHSSTCNLCGETVTEEHIFDDNDLCICGYSHVHESDDFNKDSIYHWGECSTCGQYVDEPHRYNSEGVCKICGFMWHECVIDEWEVYEGYHYGRCTICKFYTSENHVYGENGKCECGYFEHEHIKGDIVYNNKEHFHVCSICGVGVYGYFEHEYDENGKCECDREKLNGVCIGNTWLNDGDYLTESGAIVTTKPNGGYAQLYDGVLTLHNFNYEGLNTDEAINPSLVYSEMDITLLLEGANKLYCPDGDGINVTYASLTVKGNGSLEVAADNDRDGIEVFNGNLTVESGILKIDSTDHGIEVNGNTTINGGYFYIEAGDDGLDLSDTSIINGGTFYISAEDNGIDSVGNLTIYDGDFYIITNDDNGLEATDELKIYGGYYELNTNDECINSVDNTVYIYGGTFVFNAVSEDYAIKAYMDIVLAEGLTGYKVLHDQSDYAVLAYENEDILQNGILKFDDNAKTQLQNDWVAFPDEPICYLNEELYIPNVTVTDFEGNELVKGTDYTVYLYPEELVKGGVYCLVVEGMGNYNGKVFALTTLAFCKGDVNGDSYIDNLDAAMILKYDAGIIELEPTAETSGDVNGDGFVDNLDAAMILKYDAGIIDSLTTAN